MSQTFITSLNFDDLLNESSLINETIIKAKIIPWLNMNDLQTDYYGIELRNNEKKKFYMSYKGKAVITNDKEKLTLVLKKIKKEIKSKNN